MINLCVMKFSGTGVRKKEGQRSQRDPSQSRLFVHLPSNKTLDAVRFYKWLSI